MTASLAAAISEIRRAGPEAEVAALKALAALDLPDSDGEPVENERKRIQINLGLESLYHHWAEPALPGWTMPVDELFA